MAIIAIAADSGGCYNIWPMESSQQLLQPCPNCATFLDVSEEEPFAKVHCPICGTANRVRRQFNNFSIEEVLGAGGVGAVYKAIDLNLHRPVALKLLKKEYSADEHYIARFETEARIMALINHPHVVKVFSFGSDHGLFYIAMELVDKGSLDDLINLQSRAGELQVLQVGVQIAEGLQAAHKKGLIHRDVKPGNILFADAHTAKIVDFGLALLMEQEAETRGEVWGTPYYVAPEKLNKEPEDFRSDIYSLGGTLFHALAGRPAFEAETASLVALKRLKSKAVSLHAFAPSVSGPTAFVINRMLDQDPGKRYQSYDELIEHLNYARGQLQERSAQGARRRPRVVAGWDVQEIAMAWMTLGMIALVVAAGVTGYFFRDALLGSKNGTPAEGPVRNRQAENAEIIQDYHHAREALAAGDSTSAASAFAEIEADTGTRQPLRNWALFHLGLSLLLDGRLADARAAFGALAKSGDFSSAPKDRALGDFFVNTGRAMSSADAVSGQAGRRYDAGTVEALSLFVFALKDWQLGQFEEAAALMKLFVNREPLKEYPWVEHYKPIARKYVHDLDAFAPVRKMVDDAKSPQERKNAAAAVNKLRHNLQVGGKMGEELSRMELRLKRKAVGEE